MLVLLYKNVLTFYITVFFFQHFLTNFDIIQMALTLVLGRGVVATPEDFFLISVFFFLFFFAQQTAPNTSM